MSNIEQGLKNVEGSDSTFNTGSLVLLCTVPVEQSSTFCRAVPWNGSTDPIALEKRAQSIQRTGITFDVRKSIFDIPNPPFSSSPPA